MLQRSGAEVVLVDAHRIALGASARATVKVSASPGLRASEIAGRFGEDATRTYVSPNAAARVLEIEHRIYPAALRLLAGGKVVLEGDRCRTPGSAAADATLI